MRRTSITAALTVLAALALAPAAHATARITSSCTTATVEIRAFPNQATTAHITVAVNGATISDTKRRIASPETVHFDLIPSAAGVTDVTVTFDWLEKDVGSNVHHAVHTGCTPPAAPPSSPPTPPAAPPVTPPAAPPAPPKVCVPSGVQVDLHKTGSREFTLTGRAHRIRWRFAGELIQKGGKRLTIPGDSTGRLVVRFRANCAPGKRVGEINAPTPPQTAG